jgi:hypothetical protein
MANMEKIKSASELPEWFFKRSYRKQLSDIDWYREIRLRQMVVSTLEFLKRAKIEVSDYSHTEGNAESCFHNFAKLSIENVRPDSIVFHIDDRGQPVKDVSVLEAHFLAFCLKASNVNPLLEDFDRLLTTWGEFIYSENMKPDMEKSKMFPYAYEMELGKFIDNMNDQDSAVHMSVNPYVEALRNPFLSFGNVLNGHPLTIDTTYDDSTIMNGVKEWLSKKRIAEKTKARRPLNQNDFDDWEYYKIREIFDLQYWATVNNKKIMDNVIAKVLWPNAPDEFSPIDVLRTTARKKVREIFRSDTVMQFFGQLELMHGENFLAK